jgi:hypothetical protein
MSFRLWVFKYGKLYQLLLLNFCEECLQNVYLASTPLLSYEFAFEIKNKSEKDGKWV